MRNAVGRGIHALLVVALGWIFLAPAWAATPCERIVSLAPSVTEVLFDMGLGEKIVGATRFCRYPPEAREIPRVGGFYDTSAEQIVAQKPTHVFVLKESGGVITTLQRLGMSVIELDHTSVSGIKESYRLIGTACAIESVAQERLAWFREQESEIASRVTTHWSADAPPIRTMVVVGRTREGSAVSGVYISGKDGFYSEVLRLVGAENVNTQTTVAVPSVSVEGILALKPDAIVEIADADDAHAGRDSTEFWNRFKSLPAVEKKRVFLLRDDFASIPGPRYILLARKLSELLYPGQ